VTLRPPATSEYGDPGTLIAQWRNVDDSVKWYRLAAYGTRFRMIVTAESISGLARKDAAQALFARRQ
jgi:hypothetical protein